MVAPVNGKNVFQLDGNDVYVCLGTNGVKRYSDGVAVAGFKLEDDVAAAANGLALTANTSMWHTDTGDCLCLTNQTCQLWRRTAIPAENRPTM